MKWKPVKGSSVAAASETHPTKAASNGVMALADTAEVAEASPNDGCYTKEQLLSVLSGMSARNDAATKESERSASTGVTGSGVCSEVSELDTPELMPRTERITPKLVSVQIGGEEIGGAGVSDDEALLLPPAMLDVPAVQQHMSPKLVASTPPSHANDEDSRTTVMLRNLPNRCTRKMLVDRLNDGFRNTFDLVYMPIDFANHCNMGYAFINFRTHSACADFMAAFHGKKTKDCLPGCSSPKICEVTYARVQGLELNIANLRTTAVHEQLRDHEEWQPLLFDDSGEPMAFVVPSKAAADDGKRSRGGRRRGGSEVSTTSASTVAPKYASEAASPTSPPTPAPRSLKEEKPKVKGPAPVATSATVVGAGTAAPGAISATPEAGKLSDGAGGAPVSATFCGTLMLRDIPNRYTRDMLIERLDQDFKGAFDFLYMPIDFKNHCNMGYVFINFRDTGACQAFVRDFHGVDSSICLPGFNSNKTCHVTAARVQGAEANIAHLKQSSIVDQLLAQADWQPLSFDAEGQPVPFLRADDPAVQRASAGGRKSRRRAGTDPAVPSFLGVQSAADTCEAISLHGLTSGGAPGLVPDAASAVEPDLATDFYRPRSSTWNGPTPVALDGSTVMMRNLPAVCTRDALWQLLDESYRGLFDFLHVPWDFETCQNAGHAIINFRQELTQAEFIMHFDGEQVAEQLSALAGVAGGAPPGLTTSVEVAVVQGLAANIKLFWDTEGVNAGHALVEPLLCGPSGTPAPLSVAMIADPLVNPLAAEAALGAANGAWMDPRRMMLQAQVDFYFSASNLSSDTYLRANMDDEGWVPLTIVGTFPKISAILCCADVNACAAILAGILGEDPTSVTVDLHPDGDRIRARAAWMRDAWPRLTAEEVVEAHFEAFEAT